MHTSPAAGDAFVIRDKVSIYNTSIQSYGFATLPSTEKHSNQPKFFLSYKGNMKNRDIKIDLGAVQETLILPLWARAKEMEKKNPIVYDTYARDIVARIDYDFSKIEAGQVADHQIVWAIRAYNFDTIVKTFLTHNSNAVVVNIGAGLDTTFQRVDNGSVLWVNIDLPDVVALRQKLIPDSEREMTIAKSVFDFSWMNDIAQQGCKFQIPNDQIPNKFQISNTKQQTNKSCQGNKDFTGNFIAQQKKGRSILFMAAGVLCYFKAQQVEIMFRKLADAYPSANFIFDSFSWFTAWGTNREIMKDSGMDSSTIIKWHMKRASHLRKWVATIKVVEEYPMLSRVPVRNDLSKRMVWGLRIIGLFRLYNMVHVQF